MRAPIVARAQKHHPAVAQLLASLFQQSSRQPRHMPLEMEDPAYTPPWVPRPAEPYTPVPMSGGPDPDYESSTPYEYPPAEAPPSPPAPTFGGPSTDDPQGTSADTWMPPLKKRLLAALAAQRR